MKTITSKLQITAALVVLAFSLSAQNSSQKKTCIKMDIIVDGKETKIDTCFNIPDMDNLQKTLKNMNLDSALQQLSSIAKLSQGPKIELDTEVNEDARQKGIIINEQDASGKKQYVKIITGGNGENTIITNDGEDTSGDGQVTMKGSKDGNYTIIVNENTKNEDGKTTKKVKVIVFTKVEVDSLSDTDKKELPNDVAKSVVKGKPFTNLVLAPNPTEGNLRITYNSSSTDRLLVRVFDMNGRSLLAYSYDDINGDVDKTISLSDLGKGMYFVQLTQGHHTEVRKVVVN